MKPLELMITRINCFLAALKMLQKPLKIMKNRSIYLFSCNLNKEKSFSI